VVSLGAAILRNKSSESRGVTQYGPVQVSDVYTNFHSGRHSTFPPAPALRPPVAPPGPPSARSPLQPLRSPAMAAAARHSRPSQFHERAALFRVTDRRLISPGVLPAARISRGWTSTDRGPRPDRKFRSLESERTA